MATPNQNAPEILRAEILADARRASDEILDHAREAAAALLAKAAAAADQARRERLDQARAEAARRKELILAAVPVEVARLRSARIEAVLQSLHEEVRRRLLTHEGFDYRETVTVLAAQAVKQMPGCEFVLKLTAADVAAFGASLSEEIARCVERSPLHIKIVADSSEREGALIIEAADKRMVWDNGLLSRLERLWPELRRQIALQSSLGDDNQSGGGA